MQLLAGTSRLDGRGAGSARCATGRQWLTRMHGGPAAWLVRHSRRFSRRSEQVGLARRQSAFVKALSAVSETVSSSTSKLSSPQFSLPLNSIPTAEKSRTRESRSWLKVKLR